MYPTVSDLLKDIFGINIPLPIQMFGFMMGLSFVAAAYILYLELKRKFNQGLLPSYTVTYTKGKAPSITDYLSSGLFGFIIGFKFLHGIFNYAQCVDNPQDFILSTDGNWWLGILGAIGFAAYRYYEYSSQKNTETGEVTERLQPQVAVSNITVTAMISGIIGAKIFHMLENLDEFYNNPIDSIMSFAGLTFYGGAIVGALGVIWYTRKIGLKPSIHISDAAVPGLMLAYSIGRAGCQLSGDGDWGIDNLAPKPGWLSFMPDWFWAYTYPHNVNSVGVPIEGCVGKHCMQLENPVFPTPLYEVIVCFFLFLIMWNLRHRLKYAGVMTCLYLILNGIERFFIEKIRINTTSTFAGITFTQAEVISSIMVLVGIAGLIYIYTHKEQQARALYKNETN